VRRAAQELSVAERDVVETRVNGVPVVLACHPAEPLVTVLRRELRLFGARETCGVGICGTCTVMVDGKAVSACLLPAFMVAGADVVTVEGLGTPEEPGLVQQAYIDEQGFQCSFCTPGFVVSTHAALAELPLRGERSLDDHLDGCLCRCGSYEFIRNAAREAVRRQERERG